MKNSKWTKLVPKEILLELKERENFQFNPNNIAKELNLPNRRVPELLKFYDIEYTRLSSNKKLGFEEWVKRCDKVHNSKYQYLPCEYKNNVSKMIIICPIHGQFLQGAGQHQRGQGCVICGRQVIADLERIPKEEFIRRCNEVHNNKFDYSTVHDYKNLNEHITFICPFHGEITQHGRSHMKGSDCVKCSYEKRGDKRRGSFEEFVTEAKRKFGDTYEYIKDSFSMSSGDIEYICKVHGLVKQNCKTHLISKGCSKCFSKNLKGTNESFIERSRKIHGDYYDYSKVEYVNNATNVEIVCRHHGSFFQRPNTHMDNKAGCPVCANIKSNLRYRNACISEFDIEVSKTIPSLIYLLKFHGINYSYYKVGLSCNFEKRFNKLKRAHGSTPEVLYTKDATLFDVAGWEDIILNKYKEFRKGNVPFGIEGSTECFNSSLPIEEAISHLSSLTTH